MKLMIVDDNKEIRLFIKSLFENKTEEIIECCDGLTAVKFYSEYKPDYVLMDIEMKRMDGLTATERIMTKHPDAKIIIITSHNTQNLKKATKALGALEFISKDNLFELEEIINK